MYNAIFNSSLYSNPNLYSCPAPRQEVAKVNGENGARAYSLAPASSVLLLDAAEPIVYLKVTDDAGYPTITKYRIEPLKEETIQTKTNDLELRIKRLEDIISESNITGAKPAETE